MKLKFETSFGHTVCGIKFLTGLCKLDGHVYNQHIIINKIGELYEKICDQRTRAYNYLDHHNFLEKKIITKIKISNVEYFVFSENITFEEFKSFLFTMLKNCKNDFARIEFTTEGWVK
jgi:hypothetical protein